MWTWQLGKLKGQGRVVPLTLWLVPSLGIALGIYLVSLLVALSPIGEFWLRWQTGCRRKAVKDEEANRILVPLFNEVYDKARELVPNLPNGICLYIGNGEEPNAFATGRKTICAERGVMKLPPEQIKAILAHEFGHIAHRDTYLLQAVVVGNVLVTILVNIIRLAALFCTWIMCNDCSPNVNHETILQMNTMFRTR